MSPEVLESSALDRLDLKHRAELQIELMKQMIGENPSPEEELAWVNEYGRKVSDLIDHHEHEDVRSLALEENYIEAAKLLSELLEE